MRPIRNVVISSSNVVNAFWLCFIPSSFKLPFQRSFRMLDLLYPLKAKVEEVGLCLDDIGREIEKNVIRLLQSALILFQLGPKLNLNLRAFQDAKFGQKPIQALCNCYQVPRMLQQLPFDYDYHASLLLELLKPRSSVKEKGAYAFMLLQDELMAQLPDEVFSLFEIRTKCGLLLWKDHLLHIFSNWSWDHPFDSI
eukprot:Gb_40283 [translate_table: standard]